MNYCSVFVSLASADNLAVRTSFSLTDLPNVLALIRTIDLMNDLLILAARH